MRIIESLAPDLAQVLARDAVDAWLGEVENMRNDCFAMARWA
jgi:hypothetical protein